MTLIGELRYTIGTGWGLTLSTNPNKGKKMDLRKVTKKMREVMLESVRTNDRLDFCRRNLETLLKMKELGFLNENSSIVEIIETISLDSDRVTAV